MFLSVVALLTILSPQEKDITPGELQIVRSDGSWAGMCPLKNTAVNAQISGFGARVHVVQSFTNPSESPIEAVYTFPLPDDAAVDQMRIAIGTRVIEADIKRREEAQKIYEHARSSGQTAALLDEERPNIFTQRVANIMPHQNIDVDISYVQVLKYDAGEFEFSFPMVVGPRYLGHTPDPDAISPHILAPGQRSGANISMQVDLDAGTTLSDLHSVLHSIDVAQGAGSQCRVTLARKDEIPNKDFILRYRTAGDTVKPAFLSHMDPEKGSGYFTLILTPPAAPAAEQIAPREILFVIDQSGSQSGFPIEKSKELTLAAMKTMRPCDSFNVIGFSNDPTKLWPIPQPFNSRTLAEAEGFVKDLDANGGTELMKAVVAAFQQRPDPRRLRMVLFNTDGYVGNEAQIIDTVSKMRGSARMFTFGIGNSVNRYLIDGMSAAGQGDAEIVTLAEKADGAVQRLQARLESPVLTDVRVKINGTPVSSMLPSVLPDVFAGKPIVVYGKYATPGPGKIVVSGNLGGRPWSQTVDVNFSAAANAPALESLWARKEVDNLTVQNTLMTSKGQDESALAKRITDVGLTYRLVTPYTSFVAVEPRVVNKDGRQTTVRVPVPMANGVRMEAQDDATGAFARQQASSNLQMMGGISISPGSMMKKSRSIRGRAYGEFEKKAPGLQLVSYDPKYRRITVQRGEAKLTISESTLQRHALEKSGKLDRLPPSKDVLTVAVLLNKSSMAAQIALSQAGLTLCFQDDFSMIAIGEIKKSDIAKLAALTEVRWIGYMAI